jgi:phytol kinase
MTNPWLGMGMVIAALAGLMGGLRLYQRRFAPHPEWIRKLLHMGMGLVAVSFPWVFPSAWPVLALAIITSAGLLAVRLVERLRSQVGDVLGGVARESLGEIYFPLGVALVFALSLREEQEPFERRALLYCVPILILALADAMAALIGVRYGRLPYSTVEGHKTTEGSFAFFAVAFAATLYPLLRWDHAEPERAWLIALLLGFLAMMFEAIAWHGLDNLVLPLVTFLLLKNYLNLDVAELMKRVAVTGALVGFALVYRQRTTLAGSALLGAALVGYLSWSLGGWHWLLPPLLFFVSYKLLPTGRNEHCRRVHNVQAVLCVSSAGLFWLFLATALDRQALLFPYTLAFAAHLSIIGTARLKRGFPHLPGWAALLACIPAGWLLFFVPMLLAEEMQQTLPCFVLAPGGVSLATVGFYLTQPAMEDCPADGPRWLRQAAWALLGSGVGLAVLM